LTYAPPSTPSAESFTALAGALLRNIPTSAATRSFTSTLSPTPTPPITVTAAASGAVAFLALSTARSSSTMASAWTDRP